MTRDDGSLRRNTYPLVAALLAAGAPLGYLMLRAALSPSEPTLEWARREILGHALVYGYLAVATLAVFLVLAVVLGRTVDALARASATDPLTGLYNRRHFATRLSEEMTRAIRHQTPLSLVLVDIDGLDAVNRGWGHEAGDGALQFVAGALEHTCRTTDICARIGGDEFAVLMPDTEGVQAADIGDRLRARLREVGAKLVTVSVGVSDLERCGCVGGMPLLQAADGALRRAKALGKDRVVLADLDRRRATADVGGAEVAAQAV